uniref:Palmitoyltransferase n=1 Tax=Trypanosoma congolense (strain IL3000) TaxID=1068625 RepID=G0UXL4_TRYCI|nr:conserved hypothetical protein [Trypanosoma congolense IL3000]
MCHGCRSFEFVIIAILFFITSYSSCSFYVFIFPKVLTALKQTFLQPFQRGVVQPTSASPLHLGQLFTVPTRDWVLFGISALLFILTIWAYVAAAVTDAGRVPIAYQHSAPRSAALALRVSGALHLCPVCNNYKPQRAHHCSRCRRCVLKYDHHCPWLGRCIGFFNYKLYLLVISYTFIFTLWVSTLLMLAYGSFFIQHYEIVNGDFRHRRNELSFQSDRCWVNQATPGRPTLYAHDMSGRSQNITELGFFEDLGACPPFLGVHVCFLETFIFLVLSASLLKKHWRLARHNMTTLDLVIRQSQMDQGNCAFPPMNAFDIGVKGNLHQIFGDGDENGEHVYSYFLVRWLLRLLPLPAYPKQERLRFVFPVDNEYDASVKGDGALGVLRGMHSVPNYGTLPSIKERDGFDSSAVGRQCGAENVYFLTQLSSHVGSFLGQSFPSRISLPRDAVV